MLRRSSVRPRRQKGRCYYFSMRDPLAKQSRNHFSTGNPEYISGILPLMPGNNIPQPAAPFRRAGVWWWALILILSGWGGPRLAAQAVVNNQAVHIHAHPPVKPPAAAQPAPGATPPAAQGQAQANAKTKTKAGKPLPVYRRNVNMVLVPVTVTDPLGRLVTGLEANQFRIFDDKRQQKIISFSTEDAPISVGIIFDVSGSMSDKINKSRVAVRAFLATANPRDQFFVIAFNDEPHLICNFTSNINKIQDRMDFIPAGGRTALLDAIYLGLEKMQAARFSRKALLIISDGGDNHSRYTAGEVRNAVRESDVQVYSIGVFDPAADRSTPEERNGPSLLNEISNVSGGRLFRLDDLDELPDVAAKIGVALRNEYLIGYDPSHIADNAKWHKIHVKLKPPPGLPPLSVRARTGYYAPGP